MRKKTLLTILSVIIVAVLMSGCAGLEKKPPVVTLDHVEIPYYTGYWYYSKKVEPTKGNAGDYGAPMMMAFIFNIENPSDYDVEMDGFQFTVMFEDFEVNTVSSPESMWIPSGKTNQLRVPAMFDTRQTLLTLLLPGAMQLKEKEMSPWAALEKWWSQAPDFGYDVSVKQGSAVFKKGEQVKVVPFEAKFP